MILGFEFHLKLVRYIRSLERESLSRARPLILQRKLNSSRMASTFLRPTMRMDRYRFPHLMDHLGQAGFAHVMIEGGAKINASALESRIVDKILLMTAPMFLGGHGARSLLESPKLSSLADRITLTDLIVRRIGPDLIVEGRPQYNTPCSLADPI